jgi:hypothetical protein
MCCSPSPTLRPRHGSWRRAAAWPRWRAVGIPTGAPPIGSCRWAPATWSWSPSSTRQQRPTAASDAGSPVAHPAPGRPLGWAVRTGQLDQLARRLGLTVHSGARVAPSGEVLRWRSAGIDQAAAEPSLPFFLEWAAGVRLPGTTAVVHPAAPAGISKLLLDGDPDRLAAWLGDHALPIVVRTGRPAVAAIVLATARGEVVLGAEQP